MFFEFAITMVKNATSPDDRSC